MEITRTDLLRSISLDGEIVSNLENHHDLLPKLLKLLRRLHPNRGANYHIKTENNKNPDQNENLNDDTSEQSDVENDISCGDVVDDCNGAPTEPTTNALRQT